LTLFFKNKYEENSPNEESNNILFALNDTVEDLFENFDFQDELDECF
jgi:hypothetical protein